MSLFETLVIVCMCIYLITVIFFNITGRIISRKDRKEDVAHMKKSMEYEESIKVLTKRLGEISTENQRVSDENRKWRYAYNELLIKHQALKEKYGDVQEDDDKSE